MAIRRTFGWIQNPGDIYKLKRVVSIFMRGSDINEWLINNRLPLLLYYKLILKEDYNKFIDEIKKDNIEIDYSLLKGKGVSGGSRKNAICTGIIQAVIDGQQNRTYFDKTGDSITIKKPYTDDWSAEGFLRWGISCGFIDYDRENDKCKISELGIKLVKSAENTNEEREAFSYGLLSYPPVVRVLSLLKENDNLTKFEIGSNLGFKGELGFTSIPQEIYLCDCNEARTTKEKTEVRSNEEGDADKYARGIASWCIQMGWIISMPKEVESVYRGKTYKDSLQSYSLTRLGEKALTLSKGNSSNKKIDKIVYFEMLASNKAYGADYLRFERACVIKALSSSWKTLLQIKDSLKNYELEVDVSTVQDHIFGLKNIGLDIICKDDKYKLSDSIVKLDIPEKANCIK